MSNAVDPTAAYIAQYNATYQISPIILVNGIAVGQTGNLMPISGLYPTDFVSAYLPLPGSTLINQQIATFPFANQQVAANATIQQPLILSLVMIAPVNQPGGYSTKQSTFISLQKSLYAHNTSGGLYNVMTPAYLYQNMVMTGMSDITHDDGKQKQIEWQIDFVQPLVSLTDAQIAQSALFTKITNGTKLTSTSYSGQ